MVLSAGKIFECRLNGLRDIALGVSGREQQQRQNDHLPHAAFDQPGNPFLDRRLGQFQEANLDCHAVCCCNQ